MNREKSLNLTAEVVRSNFQRVQERIRQAALRSGRTPSEIQLIGVSKYVDAEVTRWLAEAGCQHLGESRPQSIWEKSEGLKDHSIGWHLIGHLQRNKSKKTVPLLTVMHSLDSERLLEQLRADVEVRSEPLRLLLEINVSSDSDKTGLSVDEGEKLLTRWNQIRHLNDKLVICGLMGMGSLEGGVDRARKDFEALRLLRDQWSKSFGMQLEELSMGMSHDFEIAIEQGATMVRVGSLLFEHPSGTAQAIR